MKFSEKRYQLFISYGRKDDDSFVRQLYKELTNEGYKTWFDIVSVESNGLSFLQNIRDALAANPIRLILVLSPHAMESDYVKAEWQFALENCQVIIPILRQGSEKNAKGEPVASDKDYELLPEPLQKRKLHCLDFRKERKFKDALDDLFSSISSHVKPLASLHGVINKPNNYLEREKEIRAIKEFILQDVYQPAVVTSVGKAAAIQGMGGVGKTVIAAAVCHDCDIRRSFQDGIYWVTIGQKPDLQRVLFYITKDASINVSDNYEEARDKLKSFLESKNCLIVLDDVWNQEHIEIFPNDNALRCRLLITTRNKQTVKHLSENIVEVGLLSEEEALLQLSKATLKNNEAMPPEAKDIVRECGYLFLAISMIGGMIRAGDESTWKHSLTMLQEADLNEIAQKFPDYPYPDLFKSIDVSIKSLKKEDRSRYLQLGVFKEDSIIKEEIIHTLWKKKGCRKYHTHNLINNFVERSILQRIGTGQYSLHDLLFDYILKMSPDLRLAHRQLINNFGDPLQLSQIYAWDNYIWHLKEAGDVKGAAKLLQSFDWMESKLLTTSIYILLKDYEHFKLDESTDLIYRTLILCIRTCSKNKGQLAAQLIGRLTGTKDEIVHQLLHKAKNRENKDTFWLRPKTRSLTPPENFNLNLKRHECEITQLIVHEGKIISVSWFNTFRIWDINTGAPIGDPLKEHGTRSKQLIIHKEKIISGSADNTIRIWDINTGASIGEPLKGHEDRISLLITHEGKLISASEDHTIRVWDINTGTPIGKPLVGHKKEITELIVHEGKIISVSWDKTIRVWDINSGSPVGDPLIGLMYGNSQFIVHKGKIIESSWDGYIKIWDINTGATVGITLTRYVWGGTPVIVHEEKIIYGTWDFNIMVLDINTLAPIGKALEGHKSWIRKLIVHEGKIISVSRDHTIRIWDINTGAPIGAPLKGHKSWITELIVHEEKIISGSDDKTIRIFDINTGAPIGDPLEGHEGSITELIVHKRMIISRGSWDHTIRIWDINYPHNHILFEADADIECMVAIGNQIIAGDKLGNVHFLELVGNI